MEGIIKTLDGMEALVIRILVWVIHIPKTILWIIFNPSKVPGYIHGELYPNDNKPDGNKDEIKKEEEHPLFEGFIPPVVLLLVVALIPALLLGFLPKTGATITRPTEVKSAVEGSIQSLKSQAASKDSYLVEAKFTSSGQDLKYIVTWWVEQKSKESPNSETQISGKKRWDIFARRYVEEKINDGQFIEIHSSASTHSELDGSSGTIIKEGNNTIKDTFSFPFKEAGSYYINVTVQKVRPLDARGANNPTYIPVEKYTDYVYVEVPQNNNPEHRGYIDESRIKTGGASSLGQTLSMESFSGLVRKESTIFLAICMLFPPLLFAFVSDLVTHRGGSNKSLRETFYAECYYFSPLSLAIWAFYYSLFFFTRDVFLNLFGSLGIYIPLLAALLWFIVVETNALANVNDKDKITKPVAFLIIIFNLSILAGLGSLIFITRHDSRMQDILRLALIRLYVIAGLALLAIYLLNGRMGVDRAKLAQLGKSLVDRWNRRKKPHEQDQQSEQPVQAEAKGKSRKNVVRKVIISLSVVIVIFCCIPACLVVLVPGEDTSTASVPPATSTAVLASSIQLPEDTSAYTEGFDGNMDDWGPFFLRGGEASKVIAQPENSSLRFSFSPKKDQYPVVYKVNNVFEYTDVQIETTVKNNNAASHETILICQYSPEKGWYEFGISNTGEYTIFARDESLGTWTELTHGSSPEIKKSMTEKNTYKAICDGNKLSLSINGIPVDPVQDTNLNFKNGKIGLGLFSPESQDVDISFESLKVSKPEKPLPEVAATSGSVAGELPAATPVPDSAGYYTEEFNGDIDNWGEYFMTSGDPDQVKLSPGNQGLNFQLLKADQIPQAYLINNAFNYTDVEVDAIVKNNGNNSNGVSLICQYNDKGWYEFEVSNSGTYAIYAFDAIEWAYTELASGYAPEIKSGLSENAYTAICAGNELTLQINGTPIQGIRDTALNFTGGQIGIALSSPQGLPIDVNFKSIKVSNPSPDQQAANSAPTDVPVAEVVLNDTPTPADPSFFTEEFDGSTDQWEIYGDPGQVKLPPENGRLHFQLTQKSGQTPPVYFIKKDAAYGAVQVEVVTTNNGNNSNGVDMVCQLSDKGQYELEVSNSGEYAIYAYDAKNSGYTLLTSGSSPVVKTGMAENTYIAKCQGNELTLIINGTPVVEAFQDTAFNFTEGRAGFGVTSRKGFPVDLYIESVNVSEPQ